MSNVRKLAVIEYHHGGHRAAHIRTIAAAWRRRMPSSATLTFFLSEIFERAHLEAIADIESAGPGVSTVIFPKRAAEPYYQATSTWAQGWLEWELTQRLCQEHDIDHCYISFLDTVLSAPLVNHRRPDFDVSGLLFCPHFYYPSMRGEGMRRKLSKLGQRIVFGRSATHPVLSHLFSLDPFAIDIMRSWRPGRVTLALPEALTIPPSDPDATSQLKRKLNLDPDRCVFLAFGGMYPRHGIDEFLKALCQLSPENVMRVSVVLAGKCQDPAFAREIRRWADEARERGVQVYVDDRFIPDVEVRAYYDATDYVIALYRHHVGSAGTFVWAAHTGRPLLSTDYGLLGRWVREFQLGMSVDSGDPSSIADAIARMIANPEEMKKNIAGLENFAAIHRGENFGDLLLDNII